jgi:apolipoprotein N-acyltransferase
VLSRRLLASLLGGIAGGLGFAPVHCAPFLLLAIAWLYKSLPTEKHRFKLGWCFGFGQALACLYWIYEPMTLSWPRFAVFIPLSCIALPAYVAMYAGLTAKMQRFFSSWSHGPVLFAAQWTLAEWLLGHLFTGFPWVLVGYTWLYPLSILQIAAYGGIYGLSFFTVLLGSLLGEAWIRRCGAGKRPAIAACLLFGIAWGIGTLRLRYVSYEEQPKPLMLRLVQGNISQDLKWKPHLRAYHLETYLDLSRSFSENLPDLIIWPEAALPYLFEPESSLSYYLGQHLAPFQVLLTGALRREKGEVRNSLIGIDVSGRLVARYDKVRLVPFGDYVPFSKFLPIQRIAQGLGLADASPGTEILFRVDASESEADCVITTPDSPLAPTGIPKFKVLICYEVIFPHDLPFFKNRAAWLLSLSNDAWFGRTSEPYQHAHICRFRAIEQGSPLVHVANTGKTCVFTAFGEEVTHLPLHMAGYKDCLLPKNTKYPTFFSYLGSFPLIIICCLSVFLIRRLKYEHNTL